MRARLPAVSPARPERTWLDLGSEPLVDGQILTAWSEQGHPALVVLAPDGSEYLISAGMAVPVSALIARGECPCPAGCGGGHLRLADAIMVIGVRREPGVSLTERIHTVVREQSGVLVVRRYDRDWELRTEYVVLRLDDGAVHVRIRAPRMNDQLEMVRRDTSVSVGAPRTSTAVASAADVGTMIPVGTGLSRDTGSDEKLVHRRPSGLMSGSGAVRPGRTVRTMRCTCAPAEAGLPCLHVQLARQLRSTASIFSDARAHRDMIMNETKRLQRPDDDTYLVPWVTVPGTSLVVRVANRRAAAPDRAADPAGAHGVPLERAHEDDGAHEVIPAWQTRVRASGTYPVTLGIRAEGGPSGAVEHTAASGHLMLSAGIPVCARHTRCSAARFVRRILEQAGAQPGR